MRQVLAGISVLFAFSLTAPFSFAQNAVAPGGTLRAVYLAGNPAQAVRDPASGEVRGASADLARELAKRLNVLLALTPSASPATVIDAVSKGEADIGFVAYAPSRTGTVEFSQTYMLVRQSFVVPDGSPIKSVADIDRAGQKIGGGKGDSITLFLARALKQATLVETDNTNPDAKQKLTAREIDAFGANRQRLTNLLKEMPDYRLLPDNIFDVPQTIIVGKGKTDALATINTFVDEARTSGLLKTAIEKSGIPGLDMAPAGYGYGQAEAR
jgi:polar amino acid transport system substrate-binding protein